MHEIITLKTFQAETGILLRLSLFVLQGWPVLSSLPKPLYQHTHTQTRGVGRDMSDEAPPQALAQRCNICWQVPDSYPQYSRLCPQPYYSRISYPEVVRALLIIFTLLRHYSITRLPNLGLRAALAQKAIFIFRASNSSHTRIRRCACKNL